MELIKAREQIQKYIDLIDKIKNSIKERGHAKAEKIATYEREIAKHCILLKNGEELILDGLRISKPPASTTEKIARGICWQFKLEADAAEADYKSAIVNLEATMAQLNGAQSVYKHLD